ncbi:hypothetical protein RIF29_04885 [Crotalaria pallida]|uniref:Uncharacterized protein n=1 Tax=Crotalaria pallida TaxID=3830 RepID=A0AAN9P9H3_CROPI
MKHTSSLALYKYEFCGVSTSPGSPYLRHHIAMTSQTMPKAGLWQPPIVDYIKINLDATIKDEKRVVGTTTMAHDFHGKAIHSNIVDLCEFGIMIVDIKCRAQYFNYCLFPFVLRIFNITANRLAQWAVKTSIGRVWLDNLDVIPYFHQGWAYVDDSDVNCPH